MSNRIHSVAAGALAVAAILTGSHSASAQDWRTITSARQAFGNDPVDVEIEYGAGRLTVGPSSSSMLYEMKLRYDRETFEPRIDYDGDDRELTLGVRSLRREHSGVNSHREASADIQLSRRTPIDLDLDFGAGEARIELGDMTIRELDIATGASDTQISFEKPNRIAAESVVIRAGAADLKVFGLGNSRAREVEFEGGVGATVLDFSGAANDMAVSVEMGVGSVTLRLPRSHGIRLERSSFLSSFDPGGLERRDGSYFSSNWGSASQRMTIDISAALGSIEIEWVD